MSVWRGAYGFSRVAESSVSRRCLERCLPSSRRATKKAAAAQQPECIYVSVQKARLFEHPLYDLNSVAIEPPRVIISMACDMSGATLSTTNLSECSSSSRMESVIITSLI